MLKFSYDTESEIPAANKANYQQAGDGKWYLIVEGGVVPKSRLDEFRTKNTELLKENDDLKTRFKDVDPEEFKTLKSRKDLLDEKKLITTEGLDAAVEKRTAKMKEEHDKEVSGLKATLSTTQTQLATHVIDGALTDAATKQGMRNEALQDVLSRGRSVFSLVDGKLVAKDKDGKEVYGASGQILAPSEFIAGLVKEAPHLFQPNGGGGAQGGKQGGKHTGPNPWNTKAPNLTEQMKITRENPELAKSLQASAE